MFWVSNSDIKEIPTWFWWVWLPLPLVGTIVWQSQWPCGHLWMETEVQKAHSIGLGFFFHISNPISTCRQIQQDICWQLGWSNLPRVYTVPVSFLGSFYHDFILGAHVTLDDRSWKAEGLTESCSFDSFSRPADKVRVESQGKIKWCKPLGQCWRWEILEEMSNPGDSEVSSFQRSLDLIAISPLDVFSGNPFALCGGASKRWWLGELKIQM